MQMHHSILHKERHLYWYRENDLGPVYGFQWRHFIAPYDNCEKDYSGEGIDQLKNLIEDLKDPVKRYSRRHILTAWNPCQIMNGIATVSSFVPI